MTGTIVGPGAEELSVAVRLAREAGALQLERWDGLRVQGTKAHVNDLVSDVDIASEGLLVDGLRAAFPDDGVLAEEGTDLAGGSSRRWVIDPLDGTRNYVSRSGPWSVCLALEEVRDDADGPVTTVAVVHDPTVAETFAAVRGAGAWCNDRPLRASGCTELGRALLALSYNPSQATRERLGSVIPALLEVVGDLRRYPSALQLAYLAAGRVDAGLVLDAKPWDVAAGYLIATEAGVRLTGPAGAPPTSALTIGAAPGLREEFGRLVAALPLTDPG
ncbi:inositol monophosphatase family protein [Pseudonocardia nematodicida]|uniref:Inositol-1-monophosphatase n=1 Tax=Pseudonocardia nematodicida TaxID=1206997 RepID=A0ABV1K8J0_9PSEU